MYIGHLWEPVIEKKVRNSILTLNKKHPVYLLTEHSFMNMNIPWKVHRHNINIPNHPGSVSFPMFNNAAFDRMYCSYWHGALFPRQLNSKTQRLQTTLMDPSLGVMDGWSWPMTRWDYVMWHHVIGQLYPSMTPREGSIVYTWMFQWRPIALFHRQQPYWCVMGKHGCIW